MSKIYGKGIPTLIDVERLRQVFGNPERGSTLTYAEIESVLNLDRKSYRFRTVVHAWRAKLYREAKLILRAIPNVGLEVCDAHGEIDYAGRQNKAGMKKIRRAAIVAIHVDRSKLTPEEIGTADNLQRVEAFMRRADITAKPAPSLFEHAQNG